MQYHTLKKLISLVDQFTEFTGRIVAWLTFVMVILTFTIVVLRYGFNMGWVAMQESVLYMHGMVFMLGAAYTLKADGHVRIDIFYQKYTEKQKALVDLLGTLFLLFPVCIFVCMISYDYIAQSWRILEKSPEAGGLPYVYLSKSLIIMMATTMIIQGVAELLRNFMRLTPTEKTDSPKKVGN